MDAKLLYAFLMTGLVCFLSESVLNIEERRLIGMGMFRSGEADTISIYMWGKSFLLRMIPGVLFLLAGKLTNERIGYGDGLTVLAMGFLTEPLFLWEVLGISMTMATLYGSLMIFRQKQRQNCRNTEFEISYLPFLLIGMVVMLHVL